MEEITLKQPGSSLQTHLQGAVDKILFENNENGFLIAQLKVAKQKENITITGYLHGLNIGQNLQCVGTWKNNPKHGWQFQVSSFTTSPPQTKDQIQKFLESGFIKGIGPSYASKLIEVFGDQTLNVIEHQPQRLGEVKGIGKKRLEAIEESWEKHQACRKLLLELHPYGISLSLTQKILKKFGANASELIKQNPYILAKKIHGIGFKKADEIARKMGFDLQDSLRIQMGIEYILNEKLQEGHNCFPLDALIDLTVQELQVPIELIQEEIKNLSEEQVLIIQNLQKPVAELSMVWLKAAKISEEICAKRIIELRFSSSTLSKLNAKALIEEEEKKLSFELAPMQRKALELVMTEKVSIITGGPGTGKSTITKALVSIFTRAGAKIQLCAPTGRAAKRLSEINQLQAHTIHQLLEFDWRSGRFKKNQENPLDLDLIIIDECSMLDQFIARALVRAIPNHSRCVFVGDTDQLPSVGPGQFLLDMIESKQVPIIRLDQIYRQAQNSNIIIAAHHILRSHAPVEKMGNDSDYFFIPAQNPERMLTQIESLVGGRLHKHYGFDPIKDIQVLSPMKKGPVGIENLNQRLQQLLFGHQKAFHLGYRRFFLGDKMMQIRNNYNKEVFNGDILILKNFNQTDQELSFRTYDDREIIYDFSELDELQHAYAVSVHKYQGSESPCIIMPIHSHHFIMLHKRLLYTALTRGKKLVIFLGDPQTFQEAIIKNFSQSRHTGFRETLLLARQFAQNLPF